MSSKNSPNESFYISLDVVLEIHQRRLKDFGGADGIRNRAGLESVVEVPKSTFDNQDLYPTIYLKAEAYAYHIAEALAFVDGNKRAALDMALTFLAINWYEIESENMELHEAIILRSGAGPPRTYFRDRGVSRGQGTKPVGAVCTISATRQFL